MEMQMYFDIEHFAIHRKKYTNIFICTYLMQIMLFIECPCDFVESFVVVFFTKQDDEWK